MFSMFLRSLLLSRHALLSHCRWRTNKVSNMKVHAGVLAATAKEFSIPESLTYIITSTCLKS